MCVGVLFGDLKLDVGCLDLIGLMWVVCVSLKYEIDVKLEI